MGVASGRIFSGSSANLRLTIRGAQSFRVNSSVLKQSPLIKLKKQKSGEREKQAHLRDVKDIN